MSCERVHAPSRCALFTTFIVNFGHLHESAAHKKFMGMVIILAGFEINVLKTSMTEPIFGCGKQTASDTPATRSSIDKNITEDAERRTAVGIGFEDAEAEQLSCGIFRLEYRSSIRRHVPLYIYKPQMTAVRIELRHIFLSIENKMSDSHLHLAMGNIFHILRQMRIKQIRKRILVLNSCRCNDNIIHILCYYFLDFADNGADGLGNDQKYTENRDACDHHHNHGRQMTGLYAKIGQERHLRLLEEKFERGSD